MPDCSENYESEIEDGKNKRIIKCKFCSSVILTPSTASFTNFEVRRETLSTSKLLLSATQWCNLINCWCDLPLIKQNKNNVDNPETENISLFWSVKDMFTFQNVGFSNTVENKKYLTCADCEAGPIGYHDIPSKMSYVALTRVIHVNPVERDV